MRCKTCTAAIECWPSLNRRRAGLPNGDGMRPYVATPNTGWTTRLGDIGQPLGITAVAAGKMLELLGYRCGKHVTDSAVASGCGVRRWDGYTMHDDWHLDRVVSAIRSAAQVPGEPAVADALAAAVDRREARERVAARKRRRQELEAARRQEEEAVISALEIELRAPRATDPARRIALYRCCSPENRSGSGAMGSRRQSGQTESFFLERGLLVTDKQVRRLFALMRTEETQEIAAAKAGMDAKTARNTGVCGE
jgi:hypothetical protein